MSAPKPPTPEDFQFALDVIDRAVLYARALRNTAGGSCIYATGDSRKDADALHALSNEYLVWLEVKQAELHEADDRCRGTAAGAALIH